MKLRPPKMAMRNKLAGTVFRNLFFFNFAVIIQHLLFPELNGGKRTFVNQFKYQSYRRAHNKEINPGHG